MGLGGAFNDLGQVLISKKVKLIPQEANIYLSCKTRLLRDLTASALAGTAAWRATWNLRKAFRIYLSVGAGAICGEWLCNRSLYSWADQILAMNGSILQKELANIMLTKYQNDPSVMQLISKHFFLERIFDDSSNNPKLRWRNRNFFSDKAVHGRWTHDHDSYDKSQDHSRTDSNDKSQGRSENVTNSKKTDLETKDTFINGGPDMTWEADPLDCVFGYGPPVEDTIHSNSPNNKPSGTQVGARRRARRRRRMRNHEDLSNSDA